MILGMSDRHLIASPTTINCSSHQSSIPCHSPSPFPTNFFFDKPLNCEPTCIHCWSPDSSDAESSQEPTPPPSPPPSPEIMVDLLPDDPFGMGVSAAIAELIEHFASAAGYLDAASPPDDAEGEPPHDGLFFALSHLALRDLLSMERVCKSLNHAVREDPLLWRCIHIDDPMNFGLKDDGLLRLTRKAQGSLQCLFLAQCSRITNECLGLVMMENLKLKQLGIPDCRRITVDGLLENLKKHKLKGGALMQLTVGRAHDVDPDQYQEFRALLGLDDGPSQLAPKKPRFYNLRHSLGCWADGGGRYLDLETCPRCGTIRVIFDCTLDHSGEGRRLIGPCRACSACILRCDKCGRCIFDLDYEVTRAYERLCFPCLNYPTDIQPIVFDE